MKSYTRYGTSLFQLVKTVFTHTWAATYLLFWVTVFHVDALSVVLFSFISSHQTPSFLFWSKACPFPYFSSSPHASFSIFFIFLPVKKNNTYIKDFSSSSVFLSPLTSLISVEFFSHLERDFPDSRICSPKKSPLKSQSWYCANTHSSPFLTWCISLFKVFWLQSWNIFEQKFSTKLFYFYQLHFKKICLTWTLLFLFMWYWIYNTLMLGLYLG